MSTENLRRLLEAATPTNGSTTMDAIQSCITSYEMKLLNYWELKLAQRLADKDAKLKRALPELLDRLDKLEAVAEVIRSNCAPYDPPAMVAEALAALETK